MQTHEFGLWLSLDDLYNISSPSYQPSHPDAVMYTGQAINWDDRFGAMWLYGPHYTDWDNDWQWYLQFPDNPETAVITHGMNGVNTFRTRPSEGK